MYVVNETKFDNSVLNPLIQFVISHSPFVSSFAWLHMVEGDGPAGDIEVTGGLAEANVPFPSDPRVPHRVTLWLNFESGKYPYKACHRKRAGTAVIRTWDEEFVLVLAHELRHIYQFVYGSPRHYEVDAERHAMSVLNFYRNRNSQRVA